MRGLIALLAIVGLPALVLAQPDDPGRAPGFPPPVEIGGMHIDLTLLQVAVGMRNPLGSFKPLDERVQSVAIRGKVSPMPETAAAGVEELDDRHRLVGPVVVWRTDIASVVGDGQPIGVRNTSPDGNAGRRRLSRQLIRYPSKFSHPTPPAEQFDERYIHLSVREFHDSADLDAMPAHLDRVVVDLHVVHAANLDIVRLPLEATQAEIAPGVRVEIGTVESTLRAREPMYRGDDIRFKLLEFDLTYSIDRHPAELGGGWGGEGSRDEPGDSQRRNRERGEASYDVQAFEATPIIAAMVIRDANDHVLYERSSIPSEAFLPETIEGNFGRLSVRVPHYVQAPLRLEFVVLHGLELHHVQMAVEDRAVLSP